METGLFAIIVRLQVESFGAFYSQPTIVFVWLFALSVIVSVGSDRRNITNGPQDDPDHRNLARGNFRTARYVALAGVVCAVAGADPATTDVIFQTAQSLTSMAPAASTFSADGYLERREVGVLVRDGFREQGLRLENTNYIVNASASAPWIVA